MRRVAIALALTGCATLQDFSDKAIKAQREAEATLRALDALLEECEAMQEPRPHVCVAAERLEDALKEAGPLLR